MKVTAEWFEATGIAPIGSLESLMRVYEVDRTELINAVLEKFGGEQSTVLAQKLKALFDAELWGYKMALQDWAYQYPDENLKREYADLLKP
jgi:hypothetical protein